MRYKKALLIAVIPMFCFGIWDIKTHDVNNWVLPISNYGQFGYESLWLPDSIESFYGAGIWFGTIDSLTGDSLVTIGCGPSGGETEIVPGLKSQDHDSPLARVYMYPTDWPASPDTYPMAPSMPLTDQESWCCYNDCDPQYHMPGDTRPIGIEVYQTSFADPVPYINNVVFIEYEIKNCTTYTIHDAIISIIWDADINEEYPGESGFGLVLHKWFYLSPQDSFLIKDLGYYYHDSCAIGIQLIKTPENKGCIAYRLIRRGIEPTQDWERYSTMAGYDFRTGIYYPYDSITWELGDSRILMSSGPFSIAPGETEKFVIGLIAAPYTTDDTLDLAITAAYAEAFYLDSLPVHEGEQLLTPRFQMQNLQVYPNPFTQITEIRYQIPDANRAVEHVVLKIYDVSGRVVRTYDLSNSVYNVQSVIWHGDDPLGRPVPPGIYFCRLMLGEATATQKIVKLK